MLGILAIPALIVAPAALLLYYFWIRDRWEKEPWSLIWWLFGLGCLSVIPAALIEILIIGINNQVDTVGQAFFAAFVGVALVEEGIKFGFIYLVTCRSRHFSEEYDGIVYAVALSLGFAFFENAMYVIIAFAEGPGGFSTAIARAFTAVPSHALDGVILGYFLGRSRFMTNQSDRLKSNALGLTYAVLFHGLYDFFVFLILVLPESVQGWCVVGLVWTLVVQWGVAHRLVRSAQDESALRFAAVNVPPTAGLEQRSVYAHSRGLGYPLSPGTQYSESASSNPDTPAAIGFCRHCGSSQDQGAKYCRQCGTRIG